ncbi:hypothetical protein KSP40_PGU007307 [Platanthera guangdongensis]|uniref:Uncharacterized protein n=1 Tax=Platanthera guangdongensis TaxID=2320717 RepID=A0ABR2MNL9_9ASPA
MGCYPLGKMVTKAFWKCRGKERRGASRAVILSPPPSYLYSRPRTMMKSVTFTNDTPIIIIPPDSTQTVANAEAAPENSPNNPTTAAATAAATAVSAGAAAKADSAKSTRFRFEEPNQDHEPKKAGSEPSKTGSSSMCPAQLEPTPAQRDPPPCYVMSPLPRWEELPRRREYFSAEYNYYPTPIREGIYNIATDPNRLTTIFSEENPNACSIV